MFHVRMFFSSMKTSQKQRKNTQKMHVNVVQSLTLNKSQFPKREKIQKSEN